MSINVGKAGENMEIKKGFWIKKEGNSKLLIVRFYIGETLLYEITAYGESNIRELLQKISWIENNLDKFIEGSTAIANGTKSLVVSSVKNIIETGRSIIQIAKEIKKIIDYLNNINTIDRNWDDCDVFPLYDRGEYKDDEDSDLFLNNNGDFVAGVGGIAAGVGHIGCVGGGGLSDGRDDEGFFDAINDHYEYYFPDEEDLIDFKAKVNYIDPYLKLKMLEAMRK